MDLPGRKEGFRVLDLTEDASAFCSRLLADLGADVIKVERPGGDPSRRAGPFLSRNPGRAESTSFFCHNIGKRGISLDLQKPAGREDFLKLLRRTDIVIESFRPGELKRLNLDFSTMEAENPRLILVSITGFGQDGPRSSFKSCDLIAAAFGGQMYVCGSPALPPQKPWGEQSHYMASLFGAVAVFLARRRAVETGKGCHIDISLQEAAAATLGDVLTRYVLDRRITRRQGSIYGDRAFAACACRDGHLVLTPLRNWETLVGWVAADGMAEDLQEEPWRDGAYRREHFDHILQVLQRWTGTQPVRKLFDLAQLLRFPWAPVQSIREVLEDPQLQARGFFLEIPRPGGEGTLSSPGSPYRLNGASSASKRSAPSIGEHNEEIRRQIASAQGDPAGSLCARSRPGTGKGCLNGIRVLDFTWMLAGPYATRILADSGAEVIKVQCGKTARGAEDNRHGYFHFWNRNKKSITLNMSHPLARDLVLRLASLCDVIVENFSSRVMSNWSLAYSDFREANPALIMLSMSAAGQTGPGKDWVSYAPTLHALSGFTWLASSSAGAPSGLGYPYGDIVAGLYGAMSVLKALELRDETGKGRYIDLSQYEALCSLLGPSMMQTASSPSDDLSAKAAAAPCGCYRCRGEDRWCVIAVSRDDEWRALCEVMGDPALAVREEFSSFEQRRRNAAALDARIEEWTRFLPVKETVELLQKAGVPAGAVQDAADVVSDPHLAAREYFVPLQHPLLGSMVVDASPIKFCGDPRPSWKPSPLLGEHNHDVFEGLMGLTGEEYSDYVRRGVIA